MPKIDGNVKFDGDELQGFFENFGADYKKALALCLAVEMEDIAGEIKETKLGPLEYDKSWNWNFVKRAKGQRGGADSIKAAQAFGMAINIARKEGHSNFKRNPRGSGWKRVLELFPSMAVTRPREHGRVQQALWIQSGIGRQGLDWGLISDAETGVRKGSTDTSVFVGGPIAIAGFIWVKNKYMEDHEAGKYPFARPVVEDRIRSGRLDKVFTDCANEFFRSQGK